MRSFFHPTEWLLYRDSYAFICKYAFLWRYYGWEAHPASQHFHHHCSFFPKANTMHPYVDTDHNDVSPFLSTSTFKCGTLCCPLGILCSNFFLLGFTCASHPHALFHRHHDLAKFWLRTLSCLTFHQKRGLVSFSCVIKFVPLCSRCWFSLNQQQKEIRLIFRFSHFLNHFMHASFLEGSI